jgi:2-keto-4-pentenoate hydratase
MAEAYRIQDQAISQWPDSLIGWKIGFIPPDRREAGDPDRLIGPIWARQFQLSEEYESAVEVGIFESGFAAVEAELVVRLGQDLPAPRPGRLDRRGGRGIGAATAGRHRGGQQPDP